MEPVRRYVIVANQTLSGHELRGLVRAAVADGPCSFHVVVPVADGSDDAAETARGRLEAEVLRLRELGAEATGEVGPVDPYEATMAALARGDVDELIVSTLPPGLSAWLELDLVGRLRLEVDLPVTHVVAPAGMSDLVAARAVRLSIYIGESDRHGHTPLHTEIVGRARSAGLAGATVLRGIEGFGASSVIHTSRLLTLSEDLPVVVVIVDTPERIDGFLPQLDELVEQGLVVREDVNIIKYDARTGDHRR